MLRDKKIFRLVESAAKLLKEKGEIKDGYFMLREPNMFCLVQEKNQFDVSVDRKVWKAGTQRKQAAAIALSIMGCNLQNTERLAPVGVKTVTAPDLDYKTWKLNFKRCYSDLKALKGSDMSKVNACVFTSVNPVLNHKPCVIYCQFGTYAGKLQLIVNARATHLYMLHENLVRYINLQLLFASLLEFSLGDLYFLSNNFHVLREERSTLSRYLHLPPSSKAFLSLHPLNFKDYDTNRRYVSSGNFEKVTWPIFKNLVNHL